MRLLLSQSIIKLSLHSVFFFSFVLFNRGRSLVIAISLSIDWWPFKKSDYPLVAPRVLCDVDRGNRIQAGFPGPC